MDDTAYRRWWQLHLRVAKGEKLDPVEQKEAENYRSSRTLHCHVGSTTGTMASFFWEVVKPVGMYRYCLKEAGITFSPFFFSTFSLK